MARFSAVILDATGSILAASPPRVSDHGLRWGADGAPREEAAQMLYQRSVRRRQLCQHRQQLSCDGHRRVRLCSSKPLTTCHLPVRLGTWQLIPPVPSLFTLFRPYLAHFSPVFPRFLRVFTVSPRWFQRAPSRNPGPRNNRQDPTGGLRFRPSAPMGRLTGCAALRPTPPGSAPPCRCRRCAPARSSGATCVARRLTIRPHSRRPTHLPEPGRVLATSGHC